MHGETLKIGFSCVYTNVTFGYSVVHWYEP